MDVIKAAINACVWLMRRRAKQKPCILSRCKAKEKPRQRGRGWRLFVFFFKVCKGGAKLLRFFFCQVVFCAELVGVCASPSSIIKGGGTARNVF